MTANNDIPRPSEMRQYTQKRGRWPGVAWFVVAMAIGLPLGALLSRYLSNATLITIAVIAGAVITASLYLLARYNSRRLHQLYAHARQLYSESHEHELTNVSGDDLADMRQLMDSMAAASKDAQEQLRRANRLATLGSLSAAMIHEVRNPLTGLIGFVQLARMRRHSETRNAELLASIEDEAKRCNAVIERYLSYSRRNERELERLDLNVIIGQATKLYDHHLKLGQVHLVIETARDLPYIDGVASELHQVLLNVVLNAADATPAGGTVTLTARRSADGGVRIEVSDTGEGVSADIEGRVFEPFFTTKGESGTGLGLSVSRQIIRAHGGEMDFAPHSSTSGATLVIELPAAAAAQVTAAQPPRQAKTAGGS